MAPEDCRCMFSVAWDDTASDHLTEDDNSSRNLPYTRKPVGPFSFVKPNLVLITIFPDKAVMLNV